MKKTIQFLIITFFLCCSTLNSYALLVEADFLSIGDKQITLDTDTGLEWLDLTLTVGKSFNEILGGFNEYTTTYGFRYATADETRTLFENAGIPGGETSIGGDPILNAVVNELIDKLGATAEVNYQSSQERETHGLTSSFWGSGPELAISRLKVRNGSNVNAWANPYYGYVLDADAAPLTAGSFLVRASPIPEPTTMLLFGTGLAGLAGTRLKRKKK